MVTPLPPPVHIRAGQRDRLEGPQTAQEGGEPSHLVRSASCRTFSMAPVRVGTSVSTGILSSVRSYTRKPVQVPTRAEDVAHQHKYRRS